MYQHNMLISRASFYIHHCCSRSGQAALTSTYTSVTRYSVYTKLLPKTMTVMHLDHTHLIRGMRLWPRYWAVLTVCWEYLQRRTHRAWVVPCPSTWSRFVWFWDFLFDVRSCMRCFWGLIWLIRISGLSSLHLHPNGTTTCAVYWPGSRSCWVLHV